MELGKPISEVALLRVRNGLPDRQYAERLSLEIAIDSVDWLIRNRDFVSGQVPAKEDLLELRLELESSRIQCAEDFGSECDVPERAELGPLHDMIVPLRLAHTKTVTFSRKQE